MRKLAAVMLVLLLMMNLAPVAAAEGTSASISAVVAKVSPSVVGISVLKRMPGDEPSDPPQLVSSAGSGFIFRKGYVLSNAHVLDHAIAARIVTHDGQIIQLNPKQIWSDPVADLAVAKVNADLPVVGFADVNQVRLGDPVFAMGAPFGLRFKGSVSRGVLSGFERPLGADYPFLQTDAPINPGNSGGPLFNMDGQVVGVNARAITGADGMGFSIPADIAKEIADLLVRDGKVVRPWLGLRLEEGTYAALGWSEWDGPVVTLVEPGGPAELAGMQVGDSLLKLDGKSVESIDDVAEFLRTIGPGTPVTVTYGRADQTFERILTTGTRPHDAMLYRSGAGMWTQLTSAQANFARRFGREMAYLDEDDLLSPWTARSGTAKALLVTEFLHIARTSWESARDENFMTAAQAEKAAAGKRDLIEVQIDLPLSFEVVAERLWAEWQDEAGTTRAASLRTVDGAPAGHRRMLIMFRSRSLERRGSATVVLHLDQGTSRRFIFDLDGIH